MKTLFDEIEKLKEDIVKQYDIPIHIVEYLDEFHIRAEKMIKTAVKYEKRNK